MQGCHILVIEICAHEWRLMPLSFIYPSDTFYSLFLYDEKRRSSCMGCRSKPFQFQCCMRLLSSSFNHTLETFTQQPSLHFFHNFSTIVSINLIITAFIVVFFFPSSPSKIRLVGVEPCRAHRDREREKEGER